MTFKGPQYSKILNPKTNTNDPSYIFHVEYESLSFIADNEISLESVHSCLAENISWWNMFITTFLESSTKFFSKPYTIETINKITKHTLDDKHEITTYPVNVILTPKSIQIYGGIFTVNWSYTIEQMIIPDLEDVPASIEKMEELNIDELPVESTDMLEIDSPNKFYDKQRVKEARLKAKLATYKAQRQIAQYCDKYGDISDSESEYTSDETDN